MAVLSKLYINQLRLFSDRLFEFSPALNIITGANGSGKTTVLEAIALFGLGRSFRATRFRTLAQHETQAFHVKARAAYGKISYQKEDDFNTSMERALNIYWQKETGLEIHCDGTRDIPIAQMIRYFPVQILNHQNFQFIESGPKFKREFLDWALFYQHAAFYYQWQRYYRALKQRNAAIKQRQAYRQWDEVLLASGTLIHQARTEFLKNIQGILNDLWQKYGLSGELSLQYYPGWPLEAQFKTAFEQALITDRQRGHTTIGPHRADIAFMINNLPVPQVLSRGEEKLLFSLVFLARSLWLKLQTADPAIILLDDLAAELDRDMRHIVLRAYQKENAGQIILTSLDPGLYKAELVKEAKLITLDT